MRFEDEDALERLRVWVSRNPGTVRMAQCVLIAFFFYCGFSTESKKEVACRVDEKFAFVRCDGGQEWNLREITQVNMPHEPGAGEIIRCSWSIRKFREDRIWTIEKPVCTPHTMFY